MLALSPACGAACEQLRRGHSCVPSPSVPSGAKVALAIHCSGLIKNVGGEETHVHGSGRGNDLLSGGSNRASLANEGEALAPPADAARFAGHTIG